MSKEVLMGNSVPAHVFLGKTVNLSQDWNYVIRVLYAIMNSTYHVFPIIDAVSALSCMAFRYANMTAMRTSTYVT